MSHLSPDRVHALIVGIERYDAGATWDLPGPARDALAFHALLRSAGVPDSQIRLHLAGLDGFAPGIPYAGADHATLRRTLVHELSPAQGDVLWVWWGGHGVLDGSGHTRLLCADATTGDKVAIDLESALDRYTSDAVPSLTDQLWIVDACETFEEDLDFRDPLPPDALPRGHRTLAHRQIVLRAAGRGREAANDPVRATGLFSEIVLALLAERAADLPALPDPEEFFPAVLAKVEELRAAHRTAQHPEILLRSPGRTEVLPPGTPQVPAAPQLPARSPLPRAVAALLAYPLMADPAERQTVVGQLSSALTGTLPRHTKARTDVTGILTALRRRGSAALQELYDAVVAVDDDPTLAAELDASLRELTRRQDEPGRSA
ncbi:caspase family protein [Streptomyces sp. NPDC002896]|uniref:effector-associated domain 2-containing protein n=1 Tax=Streptomyces sp. NPDC002896 TaxID=3154438 RepID=UPI0033176659